MVKGAEIVIKYKSSERKVDMYDIGDGLTLMNIIQESPLIHILALKEMDFVALVIPKG